MRLSLREILYTPGLSMPFDYFMDLSHLDFYGKKPAFKPLRVCGQVRNTAGVLRLEGEASTTLALVCDRCGKSFFRDKSVSFDTMLAARLENEANDDIVLLDGDSLDLDAYVTEEFVLAMDTKNLCTDDCRGLCPGCGVNLNEVPCRCKPEIDPRLAALSQLLDQ